MVSSTISNLSFRPKFGMLFNFNWEGTSLQKEFEKGNEDQFIEMTYQEFWDVIRKIDAANGVSYKCK